MTSKHIAKHANELSKLLVDEEIDAEILLDEPAATHTTYQCGGNFRYFAIANSVGALQRILRVCTQSSLDYYIIGKGSNLLVSDAGFDGMAICLGRDFRNMHLSENSLIITAGAGASFAKVSQLAYTNNLSGLEFSVGIPGTVGGALGMNAGTGGVGLCDVVSSVSILDKNNNFTLRKITKENFSHGYHNSSLSECGVAVECEIEVKKSQSQNLKQLMEQKLKARNETQPVGHNCGSVFKNPEGHSAGELIEKAGLKGTKCGGAEISNMHANFFPNVNNAKAQDVMDLILLAQTEVKNKFDVELEPEVQLLGF